MEDREKYKEWYFQSDYDLETAVDMLKSGRNVYCIFMCHLSLEKALKGLLIRKTGEFPTKSHSLIYFVEKLELKLNDSFYEFIFMLNKISVPTRYPDDLRKLFAAFNKDRTSSILNQTKEVQLWIKQQ
ncbi:MAG: HEPN domain-containing protein [Bacteroidales bacterium]